jgi:hypothetical protein
MSRLEQICGQIKAMMNHVAEIPNVSNCCVLNYLNLPEYMQKFLELEVIHAIHENESLKAALKSGDCQEIYEAFMSGLQDGNLTEELKAGISCELKTAFVADKENLLPQMRRLYVFINK